ncbi:universal stress protein [Aquisalimonas lutea]|uniref:universal stress protein n=1 Tax=Aquisalimonas lutea TaxID=1327750 RepID=UPI0025B4B65D|nr:universal stress protein [Aquisalimonas lutea]MDN3519201.1 universal stress protein [Aquisalimonas lutea]
MTLYRRILMAYDGTEHGRLALEQGAEVARTNDAEVHLLAVLRLPASLGFMQEGYPQQWIDEQMEAVRKTLDEGVSRLRDAGLEVTGYQREGEPVIEISHLARELDVDLVVVGHTPRGRLARWWHGSVGTTLLDELRCSILVVMPREGEPGASRDA